MLKIEPFIIDHIEDILDMAKQLHRESPHYCKFPFSIEKTSKIAQHVINMGGGFMATLDGMPIGMAAGILAEHFFSYEMYATDITIYVKPEHRGGTAAIRLIKALEKWAFDNGAKEVILGVSTQISSPRTVCLYERLGYKIQSSALYKSKE